MKARVVGDFRAHREVLQAYINVCVHADLTLGSYDGQSRRLGGIAARTDHATRVWR